MSQIEQNFRQFLSKNPEIEKCYASGLINRRSLARHLIQKGIAKKSQVEAVIAMLRRFEFDKQIEKRDVVNDFRINIKDDIVILDLEKEKSLLEKVGEIVKHTKYDSGDTFKVVVGSTSIKVFLDKKNEKKLEKFFKSFKLIKKYSDISEVSLMFGEKSRTSKGIVSTITRELVINDVLVTEILTASPELIIYLRDDYVVNAYNVLKRLQKEQY